MRKRERHQRKKQLGLIRIKKNLDKQDLQSRTAPEGELATLTPEHRKTTTERRQGGSERNYATGGICSGNMFRVYVFHNKFLISLGGKQRKKI